MCLHHNYTHSKRLTKGNKTRNDWEKLLLKLGKCYLMLSDRLKWTRSNQKGKNDSSVRRSLNALVIERPTQFTSSPCLKYQTISQTSNKKDVTLNKTDKRKARSAPPKQMTERVILNNVNNQLLQPPHSLVR